MPELDGEYADLKATVAEFADEVVAPAAAQHDREHSFPYAIVKQMGAMGLFGQFRGVARIGQDGQCDRPGQLQHAAVACGVLAEVVDDQGQTGPRGDAPVCIGFVCKPWLPGQRQEQRQAGRPARHAHWPRVRFNPLSRFSA